MTTNLGKLTSLLLNEIFGEIVANVGNELHQWNGRTLPQLMTSDKPRVREALSVLIHHNLVTFSETERSGRAEYVIHHDRVNNDLLDHINRMVTSVYDLFWLTVLHLVTLLVLIIEHILFKKLK